jgi:plastocyanin
LPFTARSCPAAVAAAVAALALAPPLALASSRPLPGRPATAGPAAHRLTRPRTSATTETSGPTTTPAPAPSGTAGAGADAARRAELRAERRAGVERARAQAHAGGLALSVSQGGPVFAGIAHATAAAADQIIDFAFSPSAITIHVGDTITWTNVGKAPHSATAYDHSFDTGILRPGQSASHTFTIAGTFTYYCIVHPYMHGTITVLAATTTPSSSGSPGSHTTASTTTTPTPTSTTPGTTTATNSTNDLPLTGIDLGSVLGFGLTLLAAGALLRRRTASSSPPPPR